MSKRGPVENSAATYSDGASKVLADMAAPPSHKRRRRIIAIASYTFLSVVGLTMVAPFLWMTLTALKPPAQVQSRMWLPRREFIVVDEHKFEVARHTRTAEGAGIYKVRVVSRGKNYARQFDVSTDRLTPEMGSNRNFLLAPTAEEGGELQPDGSIQPLNVVLVRKVKSENHDVGFNTAGGDEECKVRVISTGTGSAKELEVPANRLTPEVGSADNFLLIPTPDELGLKADGIVKPSDFLVVQKINPEQRASAATTSEVKQVSAVMDETFIQSEIAPRWENFKRAWTISGLFGRAFINSLLIAIIVTAGQLITCSFAAYAFARLEFPGRDKLFLGYLATMMIPGAVTLIPLFVILKALPTVMNFITHTDFFGTQLWVRYWLSTPVREFYAGRLLGLDSYFALVVPGLFSAYGTFMLRQFFLTIPVDLEDAARIDGCGTFGVYWNVILPLSRPALAVLGILTFMGVWRDFMWPMVVTSSPQMQTLTVLLQSFVGDRATEWELLMAVALIIMGPMILVFLLGQRYIIEGIRLGGVKG